MAFVFLKSPGRCYVCGKTLKGAFLVDSWGEKFCLEHQGKCPSCSFCGRLIPPQYQEVNQIIHPHIRCQVCRSSAIETLEQANPLFGKIVQWVNGQGLRYQNLPLRIELVSRDQLFQIDPKSSNPKTLGTAMKEFHTAAGRLPQVRIKGVAILRGLPATLFHGVTVHELGHVWLAVHGVLLIRWAEEGFCELLAYRYYSQENTPESRFRAQQMEKNPDPIYGEGFRHLHALAKSQGFSWVIETLVNTKKLPGI